MWNLTRTLSVTDAARSFADVVNRAFYKHETTLLVKNGVAVAYVVPIAPLGITARELARHWALLPRLSPAEADAFAVDLESARSSLHVPADPWA